MSSGEIRKLAILAACIPLQLVSSSALAAEDEKQPWQFEFTPYTFRRIGGRHDRPARSHCRYPFAPGKAGQSSGQHFHGRCRSAQRRLVALFRGHVQSRLEDEGSRSWRGPGGIGSATGDLDITIKQQLYQPSLGYRLTDGPTKFDVIGAARYTQIDTELNLAVTTGGLLPGGARSLRGRESWWDPVVGAQVTIPFAEQWTLTGYVDVGGFGVGSDITYQALAGVNWQFARNFLAKAGYRYFYQDFERDGFVWDTALEGFYFGLGIRF